MSVDAKRVQYDFDRSAAQYESDASLQFHIMLQLLQIYTPYVKANATVLDVGCGTGWLKDVLWARGIDWNLIGVDIAESMCKAARQKHFSVVQSSAEQLPFVSEQCDGIFSSMCVQWLPSPERFLSEAMRVLKPGAFLAFSTLGARTLTEMRQAFAHEGEVERVLPFKSESEWQETATAQGFKLRHMHSILWKRNYASMIALCQSLRNIGAHNKRIDRPRGLTGASLFSRVCDEYNLKNARPQLTYNGRTIGGGVTASWQPLLFILQKADA